MMTETTAGVTARPWYAGPNYLIGGWWVSREADPEKQGTPGADIADFVRREDAEFIARAANAHDVLVAALEAFGLLRACESGRAGCDWCAGCIANQSIWAQRAAALALARGETE